MVAKKLIEEVTKTFDDDQVISTQDFYKSVKKMLLVRAGQVVDERWADERARNIANAFMGMYVK